MNPYIAWDGSPEFGAALVFARTAREAKTLAWRRIGWLDCDYTNLRIRRLRNHVPYLMSLQKYADNTGVVDDPPICPVCEQWGAPMRPNGNGCESCGGNEEASES